jgi:TRAP transporter TAXI family solute receptor
MKIYPEEEFMISANKPPKKYAASRRFVFTVISALLLAWLSPPPATAFDILLGTGKVGTFSHFVGKIICRAVNRHAGDIHCRPLPAPEEIYNITNLQGGSLDLGLVDSRMLYDAVNKSGNFQYLDIRYDNLRTLIPLYDIPLTLVVRSDAGIGALDDLRGKRINLGAPLSQQRMAMHTILRAKNWTKKDFSLVSELPASQSQDSMAFCHGNIQAMVHKGVHPDPAIAQMFKLCGAVLVDMNDADIQKLTASHPAFVNIRIAAGTYPIRPDPVNTFGTCMILVASADLDPETVYEIMAAIDESRRQMRNAHPALAGVFDTQKNGRDLGLQRHPGAVKYLSK